jgi:hypothetical protein
MISFITSGFHLVQLFFYPTGSDKASPPDYVRMALSAVVSNLLLVSVVPKEHVD